MSNEQLAFGKHKGKTLAEIAEINPAYIVWLDENEVMPIDQDLLSVCLEEVMAPDGNEYYMYQQVDR